LVPIAKDKNGPPKKRGRPKKEDPERSNKDLLVAMQHEINTLKGEMKDLGAQISEIKQVIVNLTKKSD